MIIASVGQTISVILIIAGAVGYLIFLVRQALKGEGWGCSCGQVCFRQPRRGPDADEPQRRPFIPREQFEESVQRQAAEQKSRPDS